MLNLKLSAPDMPVDELEAMLPAVGVVLPSGSKLKAGTLLDDLAISGPLDKLVIAGPRADVEHEASILGDTASEKILRDWALCHFTICLPYAIPLSAAQTRRSERFGSCSHCRDTSLTVMGF